jgi:D-glycero-D-manno-heptose 1,7-bisphosphate phosphatase
MSIDLGETYMVGDFVTDVLAGQAAGCKTILIAAETPSEEIVRPTHVVGSLSEAVTIILNP